jgi:bifunctional non-homologous end joining protein LigD
MLRKLIDISHADRTNPATFYCFDIIHLGRLSLTYVSLNFRKALLHEHFRISSLNKLVDHYTDGLVLYEMGKKHKFEGIVAKLGTSHYKHGQQTSDWQKIKYTLTDQFKIVGYREGDGFLVSHNDRIAGYVLYGFSKDDYNYLKQHLKVENEETVKGKRTIRFKPTVVIKVEFMEWTSKKLLRAPVCKHFI